MILTRLIEKIKNKLKVYSSFGLALIIFFLIVSLFRNILKTFEARKIIEKRQNEVVELKKENEELARKIEQISSEEFIELSLRDKLGLAKEGEIVVVLPDDETLRNLAPERQIEEEALPLAIWQKWLKLFF